MQAVKASYDLVLAMDWEFDWDFVWLIEAAARRLGVRTLTVSHVNAAEAVGRLRAGDLDFRILFDRSAGVTPDFLALQRLALERGRDVIDPLEKIRWASDKATMHLEFIANGIRTPYTLILPSWESDPEIPLRREDLAPIGCPFFIKPANTTGGSLGVVPDASGLDEVRSARRVYPRDKYLLQEKIVPEERDGKRFWFRGFYALGEVIVTWWDDRTHLYTELAESDVEAYGLEPVFGIVRRIAAVSGLRFLSTEISRDVRGLFLAVDYVNENCDMRLQSLHPDGVPDAVVRTIARRVAQFASESGSGR